jgi:hypothetical protein
MPFGAVRATPASSAKESLTRNMIAAGPLSTAFGVYSRNMAMVTPLHSLSSPLLLRAAVHALAGFNDNCRDHSDPAGDACDTSGIRR